MAEICLTEKAKQVELFQKAFRLKRERLRTTGKELLDIAEKENDVLSSPLRNMLQAMDELFDIFLMF
jgi:hypothetical protein